MSRPKVLALYMYMYMYVSFIVIITFSSRVDANASPERRGEGLTNVPGQCPLVWEYGES